MHKSEPSDRRRFITSVLVPDRVGLLRDVTKGVFALEGNIGSIRQNVVDGYFWCSPRNTRPASRRKPCARCWTDRWRRRRA